ncbi:MAG: hypothetical protein R6V11_02665 [Ectothiorhodospiraceae bacterium]
MAKRKANRGTAARRSFAPGKPRHFNSSRWIQGSLLTVAVLGVPAAWFVVDWQVRVGMPT